MARRNSTPLFLETLEPRLLLSKSTPLTNHFQNWHTNLGLTSGSPAPIIASVSNTSPTLLPGDADGDNQVTIADFLIVQNNFNHAGTTWAQGDFDNDGQVTISDFLILQNNFGFKLQVSPQDFWVSNPVDGGVYHRFPNASLFGADGVVNRNDFMQLSWVGDCWCIAAMAADPVDTASHIRPDTLPGYYVVSYLKNGIQYRVHITDELPEWSHPTTDGAIVGGLMEKAWAFIRSGANTFTSLTSGFPTEVSSAFGWNWVYLYDASASNNTVWNLITSHVDQNLAIVNLTPPTAPDLVQSHCYTITGYHTDASGLRWVTLRNPWGDLDGPMGDGVNDGYITITFDTYLRNTSYTCSSVI